MKNNILISLSIFSVAAGSFSVAQAKRPNIILFMVDDMGWQDTALGQTKFNNHKSRAFSFAHK